MHSRLAHVRSSCAPTSTRRSRSRPPTPACWRWARTTAGASPGSTSRTHRSKCPSADLDGATLVQRTSAGTRGVVAAAPRDPAVVRQPGHCVGHRCGSRRRWSRGTGLRDHGRLPRPAGAVRPRRPAHRAADRASENRRTARRRRDRTDGRGLRRSSTDARARRRPRRSRGHRLRDQGRPASTSPWRSFAPQTASVSIVVR